MLRNLVSICFKLDETIDKIKLKFPSLHRNPPHSLTTKECVRRKYFKFIDSSSCRAVVLGGLVGPNPLNN